MPSDPERGPGFGFGLEYVLLQRAILGCKVDGGQHKIGGYTHEDAEVIAATVAGLPDSLGGKRMAIRVAELARAGLTPDWMPGAVPRCVPVDIKRNRHGDRAVSVVVGTERVLVKGKWRSVEVRACPVTFRPDASQIEAARRAYEDWWRALDWVQDGLRTGAMLRDIEVMTTMPKARPWRLIASMPDT
jgi:thiazole synthase ThiGH ThiG subunit